MERQRRKDFIIDKLYVKYNEKEYCRELIYEAMDIWANKQFEAWGKKEINNPKQQLKQADVSRSDCDHDYKQIPANYDGKMFLCRKCGHIK